MLETLRVIQLSLELTRQGAVRKLGEPMDRKPPQSEYSLTPTALEQLDDVHEVALQWKVAPKFS
jgi:DNA-binding HxlR family transcriptional regulator